jgi:hypothetical protein
MVNGPSIVTLVSVSVTSGRRFPSQLRSMHTSLFVRVPTAPIGNAGTETETAPLLDCRGDSGPVPSADG